MGRQLEELEDLNRSRALSRRDLFHRASLLVGGVAALELLQMGPFASVASASPGITLDPSIDPLLQGYLSDGTGDYATGARLIVNDTSPVDHRTFFRAEPSIASSAVAVDITIQMLASGLTLVNGQDSGVRAILSEGPGGFEIAAALVDRGAGDRRVCLVTAGGGFSQGLPFEWTLEQTVRLERNPDPNRRAVLTVAGQPSEVLTDVDLPPARRPVPNFEFGCSIDPATSIALFGPIPPRQLTFPIAITPTRCDLSPNASEKAFVEGTFTLGAGSDGIDPVADQVALRLFKPDGSGIYPVGTDKMPAAVQATADGWAITAAEKTRTGIENFTIMKTADPRQFGYKLVDTKTGLLQSDYGRVTLELIIGNDSGRVDMSLTRASNGLWRLA